MSQASGWLAQPWPTQSLCSGQCPCWCCSTTKHLRSAESLRRWPSKATAISTVAGAQLGFLCRLPGLRQLKLNSATSLHRVQQLSRLTSVALSGTAHLDLLPLQDLRSLSRLNCHGVATTHLHNLSTLSDLIFTMTLGHGDVPADSVHLTKLQRLFFRDTGDMVISSLAPRLAALTQLRALDLAATHLTVHVCAALTRLSELRLFGALSPVSFTFLAGLTLLKRLCLHSVPSSRVQGALTPLESLPLESLWAVNFLGDSVLSIPSLSELVWASTSSKQPVSGQVADLSGCSHLSRLHIGFHADIKVRKAHLPSSLQTITYSQCGTGSLWCEADMVASGLQASLRLAGRPLFWQA